MSNSTINWKLQICPNLNEFKWLTKLKCVCLVKLQMTREDEVWWWKFPIHNIVKIAKCEIVEYDKMFQLWMSIAFDLKRIWHGDLYKKCSP